MNQVYMTLVEKHGLPCRSLVYGRQPADHATTDGIGKGFESPTVEVTRRPNGKGPFLTLDAGAVLPLATVSAARGRRTPIDAETSMDLLAHGIARLVEADLAGCTLTDDDDHEMTGAGR